MDSAIVTAEDALICGDEDAPGVGRIEGDRPYRLCREPAPGRPPIGRLNQTAAGSGKQRIGPARIARDDVRPKFSSHDPLQTGPGDATVKATVDPATGPR